MSLSRLLTLTLASTSLFAAACATEDVTPDELAATDADAGNVGKADTTGTYTYFTVTPDLRKCAAPTCGGYWVARVNRDTTRCVDGSYAAACYVWSLDLSGLGVSDSDLGKVQETARAGGDARVLLRGWIDKATVAGTKTAVFTASEAWLAGTDSSPDGIFVEIHDNGIRCITTPCPSTSEYKLNSSLSAQIAGVDFSDSGATDRQIEAAMEQVATYGVIVAGHRYTVRDHGRTAKGRTASQYWTRVPPQ